MATPPPVTEILARFIADTDLAAIPEATRQNAKLHILDTLGVALAGVEEPAGKIALDYCARLGASMQASIWGSRQKAAVATAAFANGLLAHVLDFDDWDAIIRVGHPSSMIVAAALSLGESMHSSGAQFLKAYVLGLEATAKMAGACPNVQERGFHATPVWGSLGATLACASLLALDSEKIRAALGIAASAAGGIHRQQGSMVKPFHAGNAARNGAEAALLAQAGFTADPAIIEAPRGFCDTFFGPEKCDYEKMITNIGKPYFIESPGLGLKWHPCSAPQFLAADAALHLRREHNIHYEDVAKVEVSIPPLRYARHYAAEVKTGLRGKFAINYVVALCMLDGKLELATFTDERVNQPQVQEALGKVRVICDESIPEPGPYCPVTVELKNGRRRSFTANVAKGHPENPMTRDQVVQKFRGNAQLTISQRAAGELIECVDQLESHSDVAQLVALMIPG